VPRQTNISLVAIEISTSLDFIEEFGASANWHASCFSLVRPGVGSQNPRPMTGASGKAADQAMLAFPDVRTRTVWPAAFSFSH
jgi:hypothetical protein